jgi:hypothetical protein
MKKPTVILAAFFAILTIVVFQQTFIRGRIPFPGDLLLAEYQPWKTYSYAGIAPGGIPNKAQYFDAIRQMYPWQTFITKSLKSGMLPLWNPHNFAGAPLFANTQSAVLFPPKLLYLILPQHIAWSILIVLQIVLSFTGAYLLSRSLRVSRTGSALAAVAYGLCVYQTSFLEYNIMGHYLYLLAFALWATESYLPTGKLRYAAVLLAATTLSWYAGHLQLAVTTVTAVLIFAGLRFLFDRHDITRGRLIGVIGTAGFSAALAAPQLLPTAELIANSARSLQPPEFLIGHLLVQPYQVLTALIPDLFGNPATRNYLLSDSYATKAISVGAVTLLFAITAVVFDRNSRPVKTLTLTLIPFALLIYRNPLAELLFRSNVPLLGTSSPSNMIFVPSLVLAVLGGIGLDTVTVNGKKRLTVMATVAGVAVAAALLLPKFGIAISLKNTGMSAIIIAAGMCTAAAAIFIPRTKRFAGIAAVMVTAAELTYFLWKFNPFVPASYLYPPTSLTDWLAVHAAGPERVWGYGSAGTQANVDTLLSVNSPDGYDPLYPKTYGEFARASKNGIVTTAFDNTSRSDAGIDHGWGETDLAANAYRLKVLALMGVRYIYASDGDPTSEKTFPPGIFTQVSSFDGWKLFRYERALPRAFLADGVKPYSGPQEFSAAFFDPAFDPQRTVLTDAAIPAASASPMMAATATISAYTPLAVTVATAADKTTLLVLTDTYYPGWTAVVDGKNSPIYRADYAFRAVPVPAGNHSVEFRYRPQSFSSGLAIASGAALLAAAAVFILKRRGTDW